MLNVKTTPALYQITEESNILSIDYLTEITDFGVQDSLSIEPRRKKIKLAKNACQVVLDTYLKLFLSENPIGNAILSIYAQKKKLYLLLVSLT